uniref:Uncharacterized protein n=1 Tax=Fagus sylvatica TaxID=28930 RepID=A0A2N9FD51_FAGSY
MKMKVEVEVISKEIIKPSSPTPTHLRNYQLSFLDQINPPVYISSIFFYTNNEAYAYAKSNKLKQSLSDVLMRYYPLAGRVKDNLIVDCNDEGVLYCEAHVKCRLSDIVAVPNPPEFKKFLPSDIDGTHHLVFVVQVNYFTCGGIAIGACISHKIADGTSFFMFMKSWAATARGDESDKYPQFQLSTLFPPRSTALSGFEPETGMTKEKLVLKRFVFSSSSIAALKAKYEESSSLENRVHPSRVEALSAFIWNQYVASTKEKFGPEKAQSSVIFSTEEHYDLVGKVRAAIGKINMDFVKKLQEGNEHLDSMKEISGKVMKKDLLPLSFTSFCRFPVYEVDFGWGSPMWVGWVSLPFKNLVTFIPTKYGDGIEAWVNLKGEDMAKFESDTGLLAYVSTTTSNA